MIRKILNPIQTLIWKNVVSFQRLIIVKFKKLNINVVFIVIINNTSVPVIAIKGVVRKLNIKSINCNIHNKLT